MQACLYASADDTPGLLVRSLTLECLFIRFGRLTGRAISHAWCTAVCGMLQDGDKQETDRNYENMWRQLRSVVGIGQCVPLIRLVCNPKSFAQTVENIFTLSFLVSSWRHLQRSITWPAALLLYASLVQHARNPCPQPSSHCCAAAVCWWCPCRRRAKPEVSCH